MPANLLEAASEIFLRVAIHLSTIVRLAASEMAHTLRCSSSMSWSDARPFTPMQIVDILSPHKRCLRPWLSAVRAICRTPKVRVFASIRVMCEGGRFQGCDATTVHVLSLRAASEISSNPAVIPKHSRNASPRQRLDTFISSSSLLSPFILDSRPRKRARSRRRPCFVTCSRGQRLATTPNPDKEAS